MALEAAGDGVDARLSVPQPEVKLKKIVMADLSVKDSTGGKCAFHEKKARELEGCHLGGGSFGEVFKAVHAIHADVAVKLAKPGKRGQVEMYKKEAQKHEISLTCEHIVSIKGFVQCEDDACNCGLIGIVMKYMENGSLWNFRTSKWQHRLDLLPLTNRMVYHISSGMHFLHSKNIIHRDLKLENVLLDGHLNAKVADLGLATDCQTSSRDKCWGTDSHKPPEAFRTDLPNSTKIITEKYDVYCFAMTLYELLTGIHPYPDRGPYMLELLKVDPKQTPYLQPDPVNTHEELKRIMEESWSYEANDRPNFREITDWVANLDTNPTHESLGHYLGEQRSSKKEGNTDHESVRRGMEDLTVNDHSPVEQCNSNTAIPITETVTPNQVEGHESHPTHLIIQQSSSKKEGNTGNESVGRGMKNLTVQDQAPARHQSNTITAIPITETVTQNQVEGHESHPTHLGHSNVVAQPVIQHSQPSSQEPSKSSSFGHLKSQTSGPENGCHDDSFQPTVKAVQTMEFTGFKTVTPNQVEGSAPSESSPGPSASQPLKSYREHGKEPSKSQGPKHGHVSNTPVGLIKGRTPSIPILHQSLGI